MGELNKVIRQQVFASIGQIRLMSIYTDLLSNYNLLCAQVLATKEDFRDRIHYINMRNCFEALIKDNILPIVNENDVVAVNELMFTDNDELAGLIAAMINADTLIILSNVAGVFDGPPEQEGSQLIESIEATDKHLLKSIAPTRSSMGRGGMHTKFRIAQKAASLGIKTVIANGKQDHMITNILKGKYTGSTFQASAKVSSLKKWIAFNETAHKKRGLSPIQEQQKHFVLLIASTVFFLLASLILRENLKKEILYRSMTSNRLSEWGLYSTTLRSPVSILATKGKKP